MKFSGHVQNGTRKKSGSSGSRYFLKEGNSKSYGWILMKFSLNINANGRFLKPRNFLWSRHNVGGLSCLVNICN